MKTHYKSVLAAALFVTGSLAANANTLDYVYIVGAPAYRQDSNNNIAALVASKSGGLTATSAANTTAAAVASANQNQWLIPNYTTGVDLIINASFTGSSAGIESVASGSILQKFIANGTGTTGSPAVSQSAATTYQPSFTLSDTFQETTPFNGTVTLKGPTNSQTFTKTYAKLTRTPLGIEPYKFVAGPGAANAGLTNITTSQAQLLFKNGVLPLAFFTGVSTDENTPVYALTRDPGSGARLVAVAETGVGVKSLVQTYKPTITGGTLDTQASNNVKGTITDDPSSVPLYPKGLIPSTGVYDNSDGDTGYASFGGAAQTGLLLAITSNFSPAGGAYFITYFNVTDGSEALANGAEELTFNGIPFSQANVAEGKYTFWSYESLFTPSGIAGNQASVANALATNWTSTTPLTSVKVTRSVDGGPIGTTY